MCCCDSSCKCCACTIVADAAIWAAIFIHLNAFVALMNLHLIPLLVSIIEGIIFWIFIFNRRKRGPRRAFYYVYMIGTVGSLIGYIWYAIWLDKEKKRECSMLVVDSLTYKICAEDFEMEEGYGWQFISNLILICLSCGMYPFLVTAKDLKSTS